MPRDDAFEVKRSTARSCGSSAWTVCPTSDLKSQRLLHSQLEVRDRVGTAGHVESRTNTTACTASDHRGNAFDGVRLRDRAAKISTLSRSVPSPSSARSFLSSGASSSAAKGVRCNSSSILSSPASAAVATAATPACTRSMSGLRNRLGSCGQRHAPIVAAPLLLPLRGWNKQAFATAEGQAVVNPHRAVA